MSTLGALAGSRRWWVRSAPLRVGAVAGRWYYYLVGDERGHKRPRGGAGRDEATSQPAERSFVSRKDPRTGQMEDDGIYSVRYLKKLWMSVASVSSQY